MFERINEKTARFKTNLKDLSNLSGKLCEKKEKLPRMHLGGIRDSESPRRANISKIKSKINGFQSLFEGFHNYGENS